MRLDELEDLALAQGLDTEADDEERVSADDVVASTDDEGAEDKASDAFEAEENQRCYLVAMTCRCVSVATQRELAG